MVALTEPWYGLPGILFGGYTDIPWKRTGGMKSNKGNSFVFSWHKPNPDFFNRFGLGPIIYKHHSEHEVDHSGQEIFDMVSPYINSNKIAMAWLSDFYHFEDPQGKLHTPPDRDTCLCGQKNPRLKDVEIYHLQ